MSQYSGPQGKGASKQHKIQKRQEALERQTDTDRKNDEQARAMGWSSYEEWKAHDFESYNYLQFKTEGFVAIGLNEVSSIHELLFQIFGE